MEKKLHESGLNIIQNPDGSFVLEWHKEDVRWNWLNGLTDDQIKVMMEELIQNPNLIEELFNDIQSMGRNE